MKTFELLKSSYRPFMMFGALIIKDGNRWYELTTDGVAFSYSVGEENGEPTGKKGRRYICNVVVKENE